MNTPLWRWIDSTWLEDDDDDDDADDDEGDDDDDDDDDVFFVFFCLEPTFEFVQSHENPADPSGGTQPKRYSLVYHAARCRVMSCASTRCLRHQILHRGTLS